MRNKSGILATVRRVMCLLSAALLFGCASTYSAPNAADTTPPPAGHRGHPPDAVILYALDGPAMIGAGFDLGNGPYDPLANYTPQQLFHGYPILGQVDLTGRPEAADLALRIEGLRQRRQGLIPGCVFVPRHGLRVVRGGAVADYVLCFECDYFEWTLGPTDQHRGTQTLPPAYYDAFTAPLTEAGIELAP